MAFAAPRKSPSSPRYMARHSHEWQEEGPTVDEELAAVYLKYGCFGSTGNPSFRSREFVKIVKDAGLMSPSFNIYPPNRVDFVYAYACVHGPGGSKGNKHMSLEQFAYATKGIAHETGQPHADVLRHLVSAEPTLTASPVITTVTAPAASPRRRGMSEDGLSPRQRAADLPFRPPLKSPSPRSSHLRPHNPPPSPVCTWSASASAAEQRINRQHELENHRQGLLAASAAELPPTIVSPSWSTLNLGRGLPFAGPDFHAAQAAAAASPLAAKRVRSSPLATSVSTSIATSSITSLLGSPRNSASLPPPPKPPTLELPAGLPPPPKLASADTEWASRW